MKRASHTDLAGRVVIVTGGAGLLGREYVAGIVEAGGRAAIADIDGKAAAKVAAAAPGSSLAVRVDVTDPVSVAKMVRKVLKVYGRIDGLVNNAALDPKFDAQAAGRHSVPFSLLHHDFFRPVCHRTSGHMGRRSRTFSGHFRSNHCRIPVWRSL